MLPKQVQERADRAKELIAQLQKEGQQGEPNPAPSDPPAPPTPSPAPAPAPEPTPSPTPAPPAPPSGEDSFEHKYRTLQGVFAAETGRLTAASKVKDDRIRDLEQELAAAKVAPPAPPTPSQPAPPRVLFTQEETDRYGPELLNLIATKVTEIADGVADERVTQKVAELIPKLTAVENQVKAVGQTVYQSKEDEFWGELFKGVPDFETINPSQDFLVWLGQEDDDLGVSRQAALDAAAKRLDHKRVVKIFNAFKRSAGLVQPPAPPAPPAAPPVSPSPRTVGTGGSGPTPREPEAPSVKRSEIAAHYRRSTTDPTYRASNDYRAMEQRIAQATATNRVFNG